MNFVQRTASRRLFSLQSAFVPSMSKTPACPAATVNMSSTSTVITAESKCVGCSSFSDPMPRDEVEAQRAMLIPDWSTNEQCTQLRKSLRLKNFAAALDYVNKIGLIAESENHHPDLTIRSYNHVDVTLWTHAIKGLTSNDFIVAVKIDTIPVVLSKRKPIPLADQQKQDTQ